MPSVLYSTHCSIKTDLYRLRIYVDDPAPVLDSDDFTPVDIPLNFIRPAQTRLHFELLDVDRRKKSTRDIPENLPLQQLLNVTQTTSLPRRKRNIPFDQLSTRSTNASDTPILGSSYEPSVSTSITPSSTRQSSFLLRLLSSKSSSQQSNEFVLPKNWLELDFVDVSNEIRWNIKTLHLELDTEDLALELSTNLNLCLSTLKQRPRRLLAFVNPLSGKGRARLVFDRRVLPIFKRANVFVETIYTERANQARDFVINEPLAEFDGLICVGGDGMFAELCHGLLLRTTNEANVDINDPRVNLVRPELRIGIIPAGSTDAVVFGTTGLNDPVTSALQIIVGESLCIDITTVHNETGFVRFMATMLAYGFFGDIIHQSDRWRCLGPLRYDLAGFFQFIRNTSYHSELTITLSPSDTVPSSPSTTTPNNGTALVTPDRQQLLNPESVEPISFSTVSKLVAPVSPFCSRNCGRCAEEEEPNERPKSIQIKREGRYTTVNCLNMPCRCAKSKYGMSPFVHLGDGTFDLLLVKRSWRTGFLRFLWQVANDGRTIEDLPNVERYRVSEVLIRPLNTDGKRPGNWSCDGELIRGNEIQIRVHRQALNLFASGIRFKTDEGEKTLAQKRRRISGCCSCFGEVKNPESTN